MSKSRGVFQILGGWMTSRGQCPRGGGACGYLCKISGKSTPLPPLTKAFPYAYECIPMAMPPVAGFNKLVTLTKLVKKNLVKIVVNYNLV